MIESLQTTQIAFFRFATPCGFFRESGDEVQKVSVQGSVQGKIIWNHLWEHRFSVPDPRVFPPPEAVFRHRRPKTEFMTGLAGQPSNNTVSVLVNLKSTEWMKYKIAVIWTPNQTIKLQSIMSLMSSSQPVKQTLLKKKQGNLFKYFPKLLEIFTHPFKAFMKPLKCFQKLFTSLSFYLFNT